MFCFVFWCDASSFFTSKLSKICLFRIFDLIIYPAGQSTGLVNYSPIIVFKSVTVPMQGLTVPVNKVYLSFRIFLHINMPVNSIKHYPPISIWFNTLIYSSIMKSNEMVKKWKSHLINLGKKVTINSELMFMSLMSLEMQATKYS